MPRGRKKKSKNQGNNTVNNDMGKKPFDDGNENEEVDDTVKKASGSGGNNNGGDDGGNDAGNEGANDTSIGPVDVFVGARICSRRKLLQLSQKQMAEKLGITFQQIQKYEKGVNRIGAGRLYTIANILGVDIDYFFSGLTPDKINGCADYEGINTKKSTGYLQEDDSDYKSDPMQGAEAVMLLKAFYSLPPKARSALLMMLTSLKDKEDMDSDV